MRTIVLILVLAALLPVGTQAQTVSVCNPQTLIGYRQRPLTCVYRPYGKVANAARYCRDQNPALYFRRARTSLPDAVTCIYASGRAAGSAAIPRPVRPGLIRDGIAGT